jgi:hypothetical protein
MRKKRRTLAAGAGERLSDGAREVIHDSHHTPSRPGSTIMVLAGEQARGP